MLVRRQTRVLLEHSLSREYRAIMRRLPADVVLCMTQPRPGAMPEHLDDLLAYLDLANEEVFLRHLQRIGPTTWRVWCEGMQDKIVGETWFGAAWRHVHENAPETFDWLGRLDEDWTSDPASWRYGRREPHAVSARRIGSSSAPRGVGTYSWRGGRSW